MLDRESVDRAVRRAVEALDGSRARLDALLGLLLVHRPVSLTALAEDGRITLDVLRAQDHVLAPDLVGLDPTAVRARLGAPDRRRDEEWHYDQETAPAHVVTVHVLRFAGGRVVEQMLRRRGVDCDPLA